ncbi:MAG: hypothetical protein ACJZ4Z_03485 [Candidatus Thalassarchaeaceae archaeon]
MTITSTSFIIESKENPSAWEPVGVWVETLGISNSFAIASYWAHMIAIFTFLILIPSFKAYAFGNGIPKCILPRYRADGQNEAFSSG